MGLDRVYDKIRQNSPLSITACLTVQKVISRPMSAATLYTLIVDKKFHRLNFPRLLGTKPVRRMKQTDRRTDRQTNGVHCDGSGAL